jgi:protein gp37
LKLNNETSWAHRPWNPWVGCDKVAAECAHCYIDRLLVKQKREPWGQVYRTKTWDNPRTWNRKAERDGVVERVFTCSISDFFHAGADTWRPEAWDVIRECQNLIFMVLTKRPSRIVRHLPYDWGSGWPNVWLGTTVGSRRTLPNLDVLRNVPMHPRAHRWISCEPLLEDISNDINLKGFDWLAAGGESGHGQEYDWDPAGDWRKEFDIGGRRRMKLDWASRLRVRCLSEGTKFMFKQVSSARSSKSMNALGRLWHEVPDHHLHGVPWRPQDSVEKKNLITPEQMSALWAKEGIQVGTGQ